MLYHNEKKNQLIDLCQSDSQMQWMNLPSDEQLDLEKFVNVKVSTYLAEFQIT